MEKREASKMTCKFLNCANGSWCSQLLKYDWIESMHVCGCIYVDVIRELLQ